MIDVRYRRGIYLPAHDLWLDPADAQPRAFVSHAHSDHTANHAEVIASPGTAQLMQARIGGERREYVLPFGERREFADFAITLLPAGHIFGSAQAFIESDAGTLLYTGDFKLRPGLSAEPTEWCHAETLIMETTYGLPRYRMPPSEEVMTQMVAFCHEALEDDAVPVLLGYSLGKSQEILCALLAAGLTPMLHGAVFQMSEIYRKLRPDFPGGYVRYAAGQVAGKVLVCPPSANRSLMITRIKNRRVAVLTGWALDPGAKFRYQCDAAFPLTDHADYPDLLRYVELVRPERVLTLHGFAAAFAADLRQRGLDAWALSEENQLELNLAAPRIPRSEEPRMTRITRMDEAEPPSIPSVSSVFNPSEPPTLRTGEPRMTRISRMEGAQPASLPSASSVLSVVNPSEPPTLRTGEPRITQISRMEEAQPASLPSASSALSVVHPSEPPTLRTGEPRITRISRMEEAGPAAIPSASSALSVVNPSVASAADGAPVSEFFAFAEVGERLGATTSKLKKIELLSSYLRSLDAAQLPLAARYLTGSAFAQSDPRVMQVGWAVIRRALLAVSRIGEQQLRNLSRLHADAGRTAYEALLEDTTPAPFALAESGAFFDELQRARGPLAKGELLQRRLAALTALEGSYVVKILTGDLRLGLKEGLVEEAIAAAFTVPAEEVRESHMLLGDIGETALLASQNRLAETTLHLFRPIKCMLASPEQTAVGVWSRLAESGAQSAWIEDKYDGIRAQLHLGDGRVEIFSRDLRRITEQFTDLAAAAKTFDRSAILDGELVAYAEGRRLTFFDLQKRLGRKTGDDLFLGTSDVPVVFKAFDLLFLDGASLLKRPLSARRELLETLDLPARLERAPIRSVASAEEVEASFFAARERGNEGLIIKDAASAYTPGRRGLAWLKLKRALDTLDVVVTGAEMGHGKRSHVLSDYTFAVRDEVSGALLTIGKAYSGLTDVEIEELTAHFTASTVAQRGRVREVRPEIVLEIAFDSIQPSQRHASGLAMRFPRIKAIRRDKTPAEIDTLSFAKSLVATEAAPPRR